MARNVAGIAATTLLEGFLYKYSDRIMHWMVGGTILAMFCWSIDFHRRDGRTFGFDLRMYFL